MMRDSGRQSSRFHRTKLIANGETIQPLGNFLCGATSRDGLLAIAALRRGSACFFLSIRHPQFRNRPWQLYRNRFDQYFSGEVALWHLCGALVGAGAG
jgi:hypothetical protein